MKANQLIWALLLLLCPALQISAQPSQADRNPFEEIKSQAQKGDAEAQFKLAGCYELGDQGAKQDVTEAIKWYLKAATQGHMIAQNVLGLFYLRGCIGTPSAPAEGSKWLGKSASQGYAPAQYNLACCYQNGQGVNWDCVEAYKWFQLASAQGHELARAALPAVEKVMTRDQLAEARRLVHDFRPHKIPRIGASPSQEGVGDLSASGTGFFITEDGVLVTNEHVVKDAAQVRLVTSAGSLSAKVVKVDAANDLAVLKAEGKFMPLPVAASRAVRMGSTVVTVGFPNIGLQGFAPKLAKGEVAALTGAQDDPRYFQISVPVQPGNSGGALVDERGNVVGVVSAKLNMAAAFATSGALPENVNYAIKSSFLLSFLESVPEVSAKLKEPTTQERKFEDVVKSAEQAAVLVLVY